MASFSNEQNAQILSSLVRTTIASHGLPTAESGDFKVQSLLQPEWASALNSTTSRLAGLLQLLLRHAGAADGAQLGDDCDLDDAFERVSELNEVLLDEVDALLAGEREAIAKDVSETLGQRDALAEAGKPKPTPFVPPTARGVAESNGRLFRWPAAADAVSALEYSAAQLQPPRPGAVDETAVHVDDISGFSWVSTSEDLEKMALHLRGAKELAIDVEHHSWRSFRGLTCLIQLTARDGHDFVIDTLAADVRTGLHGVLDPILRDPTVVKVLHGADSDVLWLARDFGLTIVNLFDTCIACTELAYASKSLAFLLQRHAQFRGGFEEKRKYQLADWRLRPLSKEMMAYARRDTHHLLGIYDKLRGELYEAHGVPALRRVLDASRRLCAKRYEPEQFKRDGWERAVERAVGASRLASEPLTPAQRRACAALWDWRDSTARAMDESVGYTLAGPALVRLALALPESAADVGKLAAHSPVAQAQAGALAALIGAAADPDLDFSAPGGGAAAYNLEELGGGLRAASSMAAGPTVVTSPGMISQLRASASPFTFTPAFGDSGAQAVDMDTAPPAPAHDRGRPGVAGSATPSPVLNTLELYQRAGWLTPKATHNVAGALAQAQAYAAASTPPGSALDDEARAAAIWASIDAEPTLCLEAADSDDSDDEDDSASPRADAADAAARLAAKEARRDAIPRSMAEIYAISNRNRKRNKARKKKRDVDHPADAPPSDEPPPHSPDADAQMRDAYFGGQHAHETPLEFMHDIGWVQQQ